MKSWHDWPNKKLQFQIPPSPSQIVNSGFQRSPALHRRANMSYMAMCDVSLRVDPGSLSSSFEGTNRPVISGHEYRLTKGLTRFRSFAGQQLCNKQKSILASNYYLAAFVGKHVFTITCEHTCLKTRLHPFAPLPKGTALGSLVHPFARSSDLVIQRV